MTVSSATMRVHCYAGHKADERPVRFELGGREHFVEEIIDRWYGPSDSFFKVRADDGNLYTLSHPVGSSHDHWQLESFRKVRDQRMALVNRSGYGRQKV